MTKVMVVNLYTRLTQCSQITYNTISDPENTQQSALYPNSTHYREIKASYLNNGKIDKPQGNWQNKRLIRNKKIWYPPKASNTQFHTCNHCSCNTWTTHNIYIRNPCSFIIIVPRAWSLIFSSKNTNVGQEPPIMCLHEFYPWKGYWCIQKL